MNQMWDFSLERWGITALWENALLARRTKRLWDFRTFFFSVSTHPVTDESVVGISVSAARELAAFVPTFSPRS